MACCVGDGFDLFFFFIEILILADKQVDNALAVHTGDGESLIHKLNKAAFKKKIKGVCWGGGIPCPVRFSIGF